MNTFKRCLLVAVSASGVASAQMPMAKTEHGIPDGPTRLTNAPSTLTGTILKRHLRWRSKIPLNKTYEQLTPEQLTELRGMYETLAPGDEPPFPLKGLKPVFSLIQQGQDALQAKGEINLAVTVGPDGTATNVGDFGSVSGPNAYEMTNYAASILMMQKYKPAVCAGKPCEMQFPFKLKLD